MHLLHFINLGKKKNVYILFPFLSSRIIHHNERTVIYIYIIYILENDERKIA